MGKLQYSEADLAPLKEALLTGATSIAAEGRTITFRSTAEIKQLISDIEASLEEQENPGQPPVSAGTVVGSFSKYRGGGRD